MKKLNLLAFALVAAICFTSCKKEDDNANNDTTDNSSNLPEIYTKFNSSVKVYVDGDYIVLETNDLPDHKSPYYTDGNYEAYNGSNPDFKINPNRIKEQNFVFRIPKNPASASSKTNTSLGPIGISVNGVAMFNQYAGPNNQPLTSEVNSFDQYNGHPQQQGAYHYHFEPLYLTGKNGDNSFIGVLLDGFPVYGPLENGKIITNADLDEYHGHVSATTEFPNGIYHYHFTTEDPYLNGGQFYGTPGTISQ